MHRHILKRIEQNIAKDTTLSNSSSMVISTIMPGGVSQSNSQKTSTLKTLKKFSLESVLIQKCSKRILGYYSVGKISNVTVMIRLKKCGSRLVIKSLNGQDRRTRTQSEFI